MTTLRLLAVIVWQTPRCARREGVRYALDSARMTWRLHHNQAFQAALAESDRAHRNDRWRMAFTDWRPEPVDVRELIARLRGTP